MITFLEILQSKTGSKNDDVPRISIRRDGGIIIRNAAAKLMSLSDGDKVNLAYDDQKNIYYIYKCLPLQEGYKLRTSSDKKTMQFSRLILAERIIKDYGLVTLDLNTFLKALDPTPVIHENCYLYRIKQTENDIKL